MSADKPVISPEDLSLAQVLLITGLSGAGRGSAARILEDIGWYVADNIPVALIPQLLRIEMDHTIRQNIKHSTDQQDLGENSDQDLDCDVSFNVNLNDEPEQHRLAVVLDVRTLSFTEDFTQLNQELESSGIDPKLLFLDAEDSVLIRRFKQVKRRHPLQFHNTIEEAIVKERALLNNWKKSAHLVIDTSNLSVHALRREIVQYFTHASFQTMELTIVSFGFKHGLPLDIDLLVDARFLPNPYWEENLRDKTGLDPHVSQFVLSQPDVDSFLNRHVDLLKTMIKGYLHEGKNYVSFAIGCTGGKHRSVALAEELARRLSKIENLSYRVKHRDIGLE